MEKQRRTVKERTSATVKAKVIKMLQYVEAWNSLPAHYSKEVISLLRQRELFTDLDESVLAHKTRMVRDGTQYNFDIALAIYTVAHKYHQKQTYNPYK